jgi:hypothetical protein
MKRLGSGSNSVVVFRSELVAVLIFNGSDKQLRLCRMPKTPAFISFAIEDSRIRDLFVGQGRHPETPWEITDWSAYEAFDERWKTQMRSRIRRCRVVILLVGKTTYLAEGALWEVNCALQEGIPTFGVWISRTDRGPNPSCFRAENIIDWTWDGVGTMIRRAEEMH